jgi:hypothetical protein
MIGCPSPPPPLCEPSVPESSRGEGSADVALRHARGEPPDASPNLGRVDRVVVRHVGAKAHRSRPYTSRSKLTTGVECRVVVDCGSNRVVSRSVGSSRLHDLSGPFGHSPIASSELISPVAEHSSVEPKPKPKRSGDVLHPDHTGGGEGHLLAQGGLWIDAGSCRPCPASEIRDLALRRCVQVSRSDRAAELLAALLQSGFNRV